MNFLFEKEFGKGTAGPCNMYIYMRILSGHLTSGPRERLA